MFCISSLDKNERSRATRSTRGGHLWRRLYFKIRGFKIDKTGRVGNKGESVAAVQRRWLTVVIVPLLIIQARGAMISRFFTRCNRNRLKNREGGEGKKERRGKSAARNTKIRASERNGSGCGVGRTGEAFILL